MILVSLPFPNGAIVAFCLLDHNAFFGVRQEALRLAHEHWLDEHRGQPFHVQSPPSPPPSYRPRPVDQVGG